MPISIINHTPTYQGNNEPLYYMPCLKVRDNRYIDLSAILAQALNLTDALEFIEIVTDAQYPDTVFICRSPYTGQGFSCYKESNGSYSIQRDHNNPYRSEVKQIIDLFGLTLQDKDRYITATTSQPTNLGDYYPNCFVLKRFEKFAPK